MLTYRPTQTTGAFFVYQGEKLLGVVRKHARWTVRGDSISWRAEHAGRRIGFGEKTRKAAAEVLVALGGEA